MSGELNRRQVLRGLFTVVGAASAVTVVGCAAPDPIELVPSDEGVTAAVQVRVIDNRYEPARVDIRPGDAVEWVFESRTKHDVVAEDGEFASALIADGATYTHVFDAVGEFAYFCSIHPEMTGVVTVAA